MTAQEEQMPATRPVFPAERLTIMLDVLKEIPVEDLDKQDWLGLIHAVKLLVRELTPASDAGHQPTRDALIAMLHRSQRSGLPVGPNRLPRETRLGTTLDGDPSYTDN